MNEKQGEICTNTIKYDHEPLEDLQLFPWYSYMQHQQNDDMDDRVRENEPVKYYHEQNVKHQMQYYCDL